MIDTITGDHILRIVSAVGLLGATGVLVGIQAEIAQMLVGLGVDLGRVRVRVYQNLRQSPQGVHGRSGTSVGVGQVGTLAAVSWLLCAISPPHYRRDGAPVNPDERAGAGAHRYGVSPVCAHGHARGELW